MAMLYVRDSQMAFWSLEIRQEMVRDNTYSAGVRDCDAVERLW